MPTNSGTASQKQLEEYLRQLYIKAAANNGIPANLATYGAEQEASYVPSVPKKYPTMDEVITRNTSGYFGGPGYPSTSLTPPVSKLAPGSKVAVPPANLGANLRDSVLHGASPITPTGQSTVRSGLDQLRTALENSWIAQGNAPHTISPAALANMHKPGYEQSTDPAAWLARTSGADPRFSNAIPNMSLSRNPSTGPIGTPNPVIMRLEAERDRIEKNAAKPGFGSPGKTSLDLDPNLQDPSGDWMNELMSLLGKPDIPGQWISPYSQDYLNQLGDRLVGVGQAGQAGYEGDKGMINDIYSQGIQQRDQRADTLNNELTANAGNIGVNYPQSGLYQQAAADNAFLDQVSGQNQNTDLAYNTKLGQMTAQLGSTLGMQAREGLLTPKQYVGPQSGLSEGDKLKAGFLMDQINREDTQKFQAGQDALAAKTSAASSSSMSDMFKSVLSQGAGDDSMINYPDLVQALGAIENPDEKAAALDFWERSGGDPNKAANLVKDAYAPVFDDPSTPNVNEAGQFAPRSVWDPKTKTNKIVYDPPVWGYSAPSGKVGQGAPFTSGTGFEDQMAQYTAFVAQKDLEAQWQDALLKLFRGYNPNLGMTRTQATLTNDNKNTLTQ